MNQINVLDRLALFTDETENFRIPAEPKAYDQVLFKFRTGRDNADRVYLVLEEKEIEMAKGESDTWFDYYTIRFQLENKKIHYHFEVVKGGDHCCYNKQGVCNDGSQGGSFCITPGFQTPDWAKGAVMYQIFVDRFYNGDPSNDPVSGEYYYIDGRVRKIEDWYQCPAAMDVGNFYGGDLKGVWDKLDYLKYLGIEAIYLNPVFVSPSSHKYDIQDYEYIDPHFGVILHDEGESLPEGSNENYKAERFISRVAGRENLEAGNRFFAEFISAAHERGIRVILDGVFNHCGSFNKWLDRERIYEKAGGYEPGAYISPESPYRDYFSFRKEAWPYNDSYDGWWGHDTLPKLNYEGTGVLEEKILSIAKKWVSPPFCADGWRLDVAADLGHSNEYNHRFWKKFRAVVKEANPDALILAEHYGDASSWLMGDEWDTIMNYDGFMEPVTWFLTGMEKHSDERNDQLYGNAEVFFRTMAQQSGKMHCQSLQVAMNELSNHDHSRFLTRTNRLVGRTASAGPEKAEEGIHKGVMREAVMIQMTWPGAPTVYYGDEAGLCGWTDPDSRRTYPWGREDLDMLEFHRYMIMIHKKNMALKKGSVKPLIAADHLISYGRFFHDNILVVIVNNRAEPREVRVPVWQLGVNTADRMVRIMYTTAGHYNVGQVSYGCEEGFLNIEMEGTSSMLLLRELTE